MRKVFAYLILAFSLVACTKNADQEIYSQVTLNAILPDGANIVSMEVDMDLSGNFFRNLNTRQEYSYPVFVNGSCTFRVLKGVYIFAFDAEADMGDGTTRKVRCYEYSSPNNSVNIIDNSATIDLKLMVL